MQDTKEHIDVMSTARSFRQVGNFPFFLTPNFKKAKRWVRISFLLTSILWITFVLFFFHVLKVGQEQAGGIMEAFGVMTIAIGTFIMGGGVLLSGELDLPSAQREGGGATLTASEIQSRKIEDLSAQIAIHSALFAKASVKANDGMILVLGGTICVVVKLGLSVAGILR
jgi:hypothetical protein